MNNLISKIAIAGSLVVMAAACGKAGFDSGANTAKSVNLLNQMSVRSGQLAVHFDNVSLARLIKIYVMLGVPCHIDSGTGVITCPPPPSPYEQDLVEGTGTLAPPQASAISGLSINLSFSNAITGAPDCLTQAQAALANGKGLDVAGDGVIEPWSAQPRGGSASSDPATNLTSFISNTNAVTGGLIPPPQFADNFVGVILDSISSCALH